MTRQVAIALGNSKFWETLDPTEVAWFQLNEVRLCMPFHVFQNSVTVALGRPVFTHEFALGDSLLTEFIAKHGKLG